MRSIVARAENPRASARAAQSTRSRPGAPGTVLGSAMPICIMGQNLRRLELFPLARSLDPFGRAPRGALRSARTRTTRSRSVTRPSSRPSCATGITPVSNCFIIAAASAAFIPGPAVSGDSVMAWRTRIDMASPPSSRMTYPEPVTGKPDWEGLEGSRVEISSAADRLNPGGRVDLRGQGGHTPERRPPGTAPSPSGVCRLRSSVGKDGVLVLGFPPGHGRAQQVGQDEICLCQPNVPAHLVSSGSSVVRPLVSDGWPTDLNTPFGARVRRVTFGGMLKRVKRSRVVRIAQATADRYGDDAGGYLAAAIAFYGFLSFFPLVLLGVSIVGFAFESSPGLQEEVETALTRSVPGVEPLVTQSLRAAREARVSLGLVGLAGLLWTGTGVVGAGRNAVRIVFREGSQMPGLRRMAWLLAVTIGLGVVALTAMALSTLAASLEGEGVGGVALRIVGLALGFGLDVVLFLVTYRVLRSGRAAWPELVPGAVFVAIGWTGLKLLGAWYANRIAEGSAPVYGAFATTVGVLVIMYVAARLYVYGAELNAVLLEERGGFGMDDETERRRNGLPSELKTGQLVGRMAGDVGLLIRKEVELARQEVTEGISAKLQGAAAFGAAAALGLFVLGFLLAAGAAALDLVMPLWAALLIMAGVVLVAAVAAAMFGRARLRQPVSPKQAKRTMKEDVEWARAQLRR